MIWIEVLDRHGHVAQRVRCASLPATIGRAWTCDVVLDDRFADPVHARLVRDEQGALVLEDAGSLNGIVTAAGVRAGCVRVGGPVTVHLGQTVVRLVPAEAPVGPAVPLPPPRRGDGALLASPRRAIALAVLGVLVTAAGFRVSAPDADGLRTVVGGVLGLTAAVAAWAGVWALVGRSAVQHARFPAHFAAVWLAVLGLEVAGVAGGYAAFLLNADRLATVLDAAALLAGIFALLVAHFALATAMAPRRRVIVAAAVVAAIAGTAVLLEEAGQGARGDNAVAINASVRAVPVSLVRTDDFDDFLAGAGELRSAADALAAARRQGR